MIDRIRDCRTKVGIIGYPSALEQVCRYLDRNHQTIKLPGNVGSIITMAESLHQQTKDRLSKYFGVRPVARYSNTENGIVAQQCMHASNEFHLNVASFHVEILDEKDESVADGEPGRIVITDLFNFGFPLVRYDTGDIGTYSSNSQCDWKTPVLRTVEGRRLDMIRDSRGRFISSHSIRNLLYSYPEIKEYQLVQKTRTDYAVKVFTDGRLERETELVFRLQEQLGAEANISVDYVDGIPRLPSGKRRLVVNEFDPTLGQ